ncbi:MAG TPA: DNA polymerase domain-containing protein [Candidatus Acidoferrum sp.]|nr:DNA polymerase domain-containing protein [Candidatus Acidoferrum sp.]
MSGSYLLDATVTETNAVQLRLLDKDGHIREFTDTQYKPYFLTAHPLTRENEEVITYFSGTVELVNKFDLFTGEKRTFAKVSWPNRKVAGKAAEKFSLRWENDVDFAGSYVYDHGLNFGALHTEDLKPVLSVPAETAGIAGSRFLDAQDSDPQKYAQIIQWLRLLDQPVPFVDSKVLNFGQVEPESLYRAWMLSRIANVPLSQALESHRVSDWWKSIIYTYLRKSVVLIPTAQELTKGKPTHVVAGALTVKPKAGIYYNTVVCDFESLYAGCIDSFNLSYETVDCGHAECVRNCIPDFDGHVCTLRRGFYSVLVGALKDLRIRIFKPASKNPALPDEKRRRASVIDKLLKLILVSSYGVTVRIRGLACPPLAESITGYGRHVLKESWRMAEGKAMRPVYGDTDSLFLDDPSNEQVEWLIKSVKERFWLDLAVDKRYSLCVLPNAKKAYFGILPDGTPDVKGVTAIKSNSPGYIYNVFNQCVAELSTIKNSEEFAEAKSRIKEIVKKNVANLKKRVVNLEDLTYSVRLNFDPNEKMTGTRSLHQPYQCALQLIDMGKTLKRSDVVSFIKVRPFNYKGRIFTVKPSAAVASLQDINIEDYVRNLLTALNQVFEPMNIKLDIEKDAEMSRWIIN